MSNIIVNLRHINNKNTTSFNIFSKIYEELSVPQNYYSNFSDWFNRVSQEIACRDRSIIIASFKSKIVGVNILKHTNVEQKLCTFWVNPEFRNKGINDLLLLESINYFSSSALITIPERVLNNFSKMILKYNFEFVVKKENLYKNNQSEYFFYIQPNIIKNLINQGVPLTAYLTDSNNSEVPFPL